MKKACAYKQAFMVKLVFSFLFKKTSFHVRVAIAKIILYLTKNPKKKHVSHTNFHFFFQIRDIFTDLHNYMALSNTSLYFIKWKLNEFKKYTYWYIFDAFIIIVIKKLLNNLELSYNFQINKSKLIFYEQIDKDHLLFHQTDNESNITLIE